MAAIAKMDVEIDKLEGMVDRVDSNNGSFVRLFSNSADLPSLDLQSPFDGVEQITFISIETGVEFEFSCAASE